MIFDFFILNFLIMPIYEYKCKNCKAKFELLITSCGIEVPQKCPGCGSKNIEKLISSFSTKNTSRGCGECSGCGGCF
ncbi:MAG: zinc ribbon domain-containing protein [Candidatus Omnitrophica bacterium]|nr:zinc ribbon domain-containing protein [Candidatus Omnitrophota bacterium]